MDGTVHARYIYYLYSIREEGCTGLMILKLTKTQRKYDSSSHYFVISSPMIVQKKVLDGTSKII